MGRLRFVFITYLLIFLLPILAITIFEITYWGRVYPNVRIAKIPLSGLGRKEVEEKIIEETIRHQNKTLTFRVNAEQYITIDPNSYIVSYDIERAGASALKYGREGNIFSQLVQRLNSLFLTTDIPITYDLDTITADTLLADQLRPFEKEVLNTEIVNTPNGLVLSPAKPGRLANREKAIRELESYLAYTSDQIIFDIEFKNVEPQTTPANTREALDLAQRFTTTPITLTYQDKTWYIDGERLQSLIDYKFDDTTQKVTLHFQSYKVASISSEVAQQIDKIPQEAKIETVGGKTIVTSESQEGQKVDIEKLTQEISQRAYNPGLPSTISVPVVKLMPAVTATNVAQNGIKEVIAVGRSYFKGSSEPRIHNIELASEKLNGVIIKPGEVFSMYKVVGNIEKRTGFEDSVIIKNGRTVTGVGGGVCQVSSTLFRAAFNAGLPIVTRSPHSFRVGYYEQNSPPGLDAAIFFPGQDFKFKNDMSQPLLIQTVLNKKMHLLEFKLWGESDGRFVKVASPSITNELPPPPELKINDPSLPKGQIKQTDVSAYGATVTVVRTITKNSKSSQDSIVSKYRPWQAVFRIGTKIN